MMSLVMLESLRAWWPELILSAGALLTVLAGVCGTRSAPALVVAWLSLLAGGVALWHAPVPTSTALFFGLIVCDPFSLVFRWLALGVAAMVTLLLTGSREIEASARGEAVGLVLLIGVGLMVMAEATHLLMAYVGMELVSLSSYVLVGFVHDQRSSEASLKYLLFGALSSGIMLFGMSLLFGVTGTLAFSELLSASATLSGPALHALAVAVSLVLVGLGFKISMVPFHMWTPDVYEGAPTAVTALLSVGPKAAGFALLLRAMASLQPAWPMLAPLLLGFTVVTMTLGNVVALVQTNVKRLLAYSTIGQVGYLLIGMVVGTPAGVQALLVYLVAYVCMNLGAFACVVAVVNDTGSESIEAFRGLSQRAPVLALACTLCLLSLAGIPPLIGFLGKFLLFGSAIGAHQLWLALAGVANSAIALYYYMTIVRAMYFLAPLDPQPLNAGLPLCLTVGLCSAATLILGLAPGPLLHLLTAASSINLL